MNMAPIINVGITIQGQILLNQKSITSIVFMSPKLVEASDIYAQGEVKSAIAGPW